MKKIARRVRRAPLLEHERVTVHHGDCLKVIASMPEASVDTIVTDPPYHLTQASRGGSPRKQGNGPAGRYHVGEGGFMGKTWDGGGIAFDPETWRAALRVAKPGAMLLAFGGTRTFHRLACAVEDAGWELRNTIMYMYGSGFPKSLNISKAIDKAAGAEREKIGKSPNHRSLKSTNTMCGEPHSGDGSITAPATEAAKLWDGWGTAFKPAWEPIILAMKPLDGTFAANALAHGVAGLWVDGGRIGVERREFKGMSQKQPEGAGTFRDDEWKPKNVTTIAHGRWPANVVLSHSPDCVQVGTEPDPGYTINRFDDGAKPFGGGAGHEYESEQIPGGEREVYACVPGCPVRMLDEQSGDKPSSARPNAKGKKYPNQRTVTVAPTDGAHSSLHADTGGASRFFYTAKSSTTERVLGCPPGYQNRHPTVKPLDLCRYLCRLTRTPTGGVVLDPFSGSGSIAVAALLEGRRAVAIELEEESANATVARVQAALKYGNKLQGLKRYRVKGRRKIAKRRR